MDRKSLNYVFMGRRRDSAKAFMDVEGEGAFFSIPYRKWRELLFIGALVREGETYIRDPSRPLPFFRDPNLFPERARFRVEVEGDRVRIQRVDSD
jgi:hypothetical protein